MKIKTLILASMLVIPLTAAEEPIIKMDIKYDNGDVSLEDYQVTSGYVSPQTSGDAEYLLRITKGSGTVYSSQFNIERQVNIDGPEGGESRMLNETTKRLIAPYNTTSEKIEIYRDREKIIEKNISKDNINIELAENGSNSSEQKTDQGQKTDQEESSGGAPWIIIAAASLILILGTVIYLSIVPEDH